MPATTPLPDGIDVELIVGLIGGKGSAAYEVPKEVMPMLGALGASVHIYVDPDDRLRSVRRPNCRSALLERQAVTMVVEGEPGIFPPGIPRTPVEAIRKLVQAIRRRLRRTP